MAGFTTNNNEHLIRAELWSRELKELFQEELYTTRYLRMLNDFPDGDTFTIPSIGDMLAQDYEEGQAVKYTAMDTGEFQFQITEYVQSGTYITNKMKQDSFYMSDLVSRFVPYQHRAIMERFETDFLRVGPQQQTAADLNNINGAAHRWVATGDSNNVISFEDFARARYSLRKANAPMTNLICIVDPSVAFTFNTLANVTNVINNPQWEGIIRDGMDSGLQFKFNVLGWDVYESNFLHQNTAAETINSVAAPTNAVNNIFFSAAGGDAMPIVGAVRQAPQVDGEYNKDLQREEFVTTMRYGMKLYRPENFITVLTDPTVADPTTAA